MNAIFPTDSFKIQFGRHVFSKKSPIWAERDLCLLWRIMASTDLFRALLISYLGLWLLILPTYLTSLTWGQNHIFLTFVSSQTPGQYVLSRHWSFCSYFLLYLKCALRRIPQQSLPSFYVAAGFFRGPPIPQSQFLRFRVGEMPPGMYANPSVIFMGDLICIVQIWESFHRDCTFGPM